LASSTVEQRSAATHVIPARSVERMDGIIFVQWLGAWSSVRSASPIADEAKCLKVAAFGRTVEELGYTNHLTARV
jgi:hypothetical protein